MQSQSESRSQPHSLPQLRLQSSAVLRFGFEEPQTLITQENFDFFLGQTIPSYEPRFLFSTFLQEEEICRCVYSIEAHVLVPKLFFKSNCFDDLGLVTSILKVLIIESEQTGLSPQIRVRSYGNSVIENALTGFGFIRLSENEFVRSLNPTKGSLLRTTKQLVTERIRTAAKVGRGFAVSTANLDASGLQALSQEYNEIAWGLTSWARNAVIAEDETAIVERFAKNKTVVEIGAGSGRISDLICTVAQSTTLTDYTHESCQVLENKFRAHPSVTVLQDDITATELQPAKFDVVFFLENGLGNLLSIEDRQKAILQMCSLVQSAGRLVLGLRSLEQSPCAHVMVASQNERILGIYHTFARDEITPLLPAEFYIEEVIHGEPRPAGGEAFFLTIRRK